MVSQGQATAWMLLLLAGASLSGCFGGSGEPPLTLEEQAALATGVAGRVTDEEFIPLADAVVRILETDAWMRTSALGAYAFQGLEPGEYTLTASMFGFHTLTYRAKVHSTATTELNFHLKDRPTGSPYHATDVHGGFIACEIAVGTVPEDTQYANCGQEVEDTQGDNRTGLIEFGPGAFRALAELDWTAATPLAKKLTLGVRPDPDRLEPQKFGEVQGLPGIRVVVVESMLQSMYPQGGVLTVYGRAAPSIDEHGEMDAMRGVQHPPISAGWAVNQGFDAYVTVFYYTHGPPSFTAIG